MSTYLCEGQALIELSARGNAHAMAGGSNTTESPAGTAAEVL